MCYRRKIKARMTIKIATSAAIKDNETDATSAGPSGAANWQRENLTSVEPCRHNDRSYGIIRTCGDQKGRRGVEFDRRRWEGMRREDFQ